MKKNEFPFPTILSCTRGLKTFAKNLLQRSSLFDFVSDLAKASSSASCEQAKQERKTLLEWEKSCQKLFPKPLAEPRGSVLVIGQTRVDFVILESFVLKAFEAAGLEPIVFSGPGEAVKRAYAAEGISKRFIFQWFCPLPSLRKARNSAKRIKSFNDLISHQYRGIGIGKFVASTMMRMLRQGNIPINEPQVFQSVVERLAESMTFADGALQLIDTFKPLAAVFVDRGYSPSGELYDACILKAIPCYTLNAGHRNNSLMVKRFTQENSNVHPSSLSKESWATILKLPWSENLTKKVREELTWCYSSGEWYSEVGTQVNKQSVTKTSLQASLEIDPSKKTAVIFSHIFWDATFFWGVDLFRDYEDWFVQTVKAACANPRVNWLVKVHPANVVKNHRDGVGGDPSEIKALQKHIGPLPPHVRVLPADWAVSTFSLFQIMDYCLTVRGTVGIEAAMLGKRVLTAGTGRFDSYGFTTDFNSTSEYLKALAKIEVYSPLSPPEQELAIRYAYGVFLGRPLPLSSFHAEFQKDAKATLNAHWNLKSFEELLQAKDVRKLADWIVSGREDFLTLPET